MGFTSCQKDLEIGVRGRECVWRREGKVRDDVKKRKGTEVEIERGGWDLLAAKKRFRDRSQRERVCMEERGQGEG